MAFRMSIRRYACLVRTGVQLLEDIALMILQKKLSSRLYFFLCNLENNFYFLQNK